MLPRDLFVQCRQPSLQEHVGERSLLIWGDLGQWLVVDKEACDLIGIFSMKRSVNDGLAEYARRLGKDRAEVEADVLTVLNALFDRSILATDLKPAEPAEEKLSIASLTFNITNRCNLRCPWCYNIDLQSAETPVSEVMNWIAQGHQALDENANFIILGGEPFLDTARLIETVTRAREFFPERFWCPQMVRGWNQIRLRSLPGQRLRFRCL